MFPFKVVDKSNMSYIVVGPVYKNKEIVLLAVGQGGAFGELSPSEVKFAGFLIPPSSAPRQEEKEESKIWAPGRVM